MTKQRATILKIVNASSDHLTAEEVYSKTKEYLPDVALATVYNNLAALSESGAIRKIPMPNGICRYDKNIPHDHLVCDKCGKVFDVKIDLLDGEDVLYKLKKLTGKDIKSYELIMRFTCDECLKRIKESESLIQISYKNIKSIK